MAHLGDFDASAVVYGKFTTFRPSTGAAFTLGGAPALAVYKDNSTTQSTAGVSITADFDGLAGLNHFTIDTSADGTFYSAGSFFDVVITTGTVDGVSVVGAVVASFTVRKTSALKPTTAGRMLDVSAGGEAGVDWANVGSPTTTVNLSGTTVKTATDVEADTQDIQARLPAALVSGRIDSSVGAMASGVLTAAAIAADAITDAKVASDVTIASVTGAVGSVTGAVGSVTGNVGGNVNGSVASVASGGITAASFAADAITAAKIAADVSTEIATGVWASGTRVLTAGTNIVLAKGTGVTGFNDLSAAEVNAEADTAIADAALATAANLATIGTVVDAIKVTTDKLDDTLEDSGSGAWIFTGAALANGPSGGGGGLDAAGVRAAVGLATANLDTQLGALQTDTNDIQTRLPAALVSGRMDASVGAMAASVLTAAATAADYVTEVQNGLATEAGLTTVDGKVDTIDGIVDAILVDTAEIGAAGAGLTAVASAANLATLAGYVDTEVAAIKAKTDLIPAAPAAAGDIPSAAAIADAVWDEAVDGSTTARESVRLANSTLGGKASGLETTEVTFRDLADTKDRIVATVDADGNRAVVARDLS